MRQSNVHKGRSQVPECDLCVIQHRVTTSEFLYDRRNTDISMCEENSQVLESPIISYWESSQTS